jgi:putative FmdB family regulatory protein
MPIYEYKCPACSGRFQKLVQGFNDPPGLACPRCGNNQVRRAVSQFATLKSEEARVEAMADPINFAGLDENDPRSIARWAKRMGKELGEDAGEDWEEMVDQMLDEEMSAEAGDEVPDDGTTPRPAKKANDLGWG